MISDSMNLSDIADNVPKILPDVGIKRLGWEEYENRSFMIFNLSEFKGWENENGFGRAVYNYNFYVFNRSNGKIAQIRSYNDDFAS